MVYIARNLGVTEYVLYRILSLLAEIKRIQNTGSFYIWNILAAIREHVIAYQMQTMARIIYRQIIETGLQNCFIIGQVEQVSRFGDAQVNKPK